MKNKGILTMEDMEAYDREELSREGEALEVVKSSTLPLPEPTIKEVPSSRQVKNNLVGDIFKSRTTKTIDEKHDEIEFIRADSKVYPSRPMETNTSPPLCDNMSDVLISNAKMVECEILVKIPVFKIIDEEFFNSIIKNMNVDPNDIAESILKININEININDLIKKAILLKFTNNY